MRTAVILMAAALAFASTTAVTMPAWAANEWGIEHEEKARFEARVVDILCELTGDCPADCGAGTRQLGLLKDDGTLLLATKNFDPFAGAVNDLVGFCGQRIEADGLLISNPKMPLFALQFKRPIGGEWSRANQFGKDWLKANPGQEKANQWFSNDATVKRLIAEQGVFGIPGLEPEE